MKHAFVIHFPNSLTVLRLFLAIAFPLLSKQWQMPAIYLALLTEFFDGFLARMWQVESPLGALLDPIADKAFVLSVTITLYFSSDLPWWQLFLVTSRDLIVFCGSCMVAMEKNWKAFLNVKPRMSGKIATTFQFVFIISFFSYQRLFPWLTWSTMAVSLLAGLDYLLLFKKENYYRAHSADLN